MATPVTAFRFTEAELAQLDRLVDELLCNRTDVLRAGIASLRQDTEARSRIAAESRARAFLKSLRTQYGENAVLELVDDVDPNWRLNGQPVDEDVLKPIVKRQGDRWVLNLIDPNSGVGISNVDFWFEDEVRHAVVPLRKLWVHSDFHPVSEPETRLLRDGRTVLAIAEDDGSTRYRVLADDGSTTELEAEFVPQTIEPEPSVGIGVRRESSKPSFGPHLGAGWGGKLILTGDLEQDREDVASVLRRLAERTEAGELDELLTIDVDIRQ